MSGSSKIIGLIEDLFGRAKGISSIYDQGVAGFSDIEGRLVQLASQAAQQQYLGATDPVLDAFSSANSYLRAIYALLRAAQTPNVTRHIIRQAIIPGDGTAWTLYPQDGTTFQSLASVGSKIALSGGATLPPFSVPQPIFAFPSRSGLMQTAQSFSFGHIEEDAPIIQLNACFALPFLAWAPGITIPPPGVGFGLIDKPASDPTFTGIWVQLGTPSDGTAITSWNRPFPMVVTIGNGSTPQSFAISTINTPQSDARPGGITISWNRSRIGISLYRGTRGILTSPGAIPQWWPYSFFPWEWPYPWPYLEQTIIQHWGDTAVYPGVSPLAIPPPFPVKASMTWQGLGCSEIDIEKVLYSAASGGPPPPTIPPITTWPQPPQTPPPLQIVPPVPVPVGPSMPASDNNQQALTLAIGIINSTFKALYPNNPEVYAPASATAAALLAAPELQGISATAALNNYLLTLSANYNNALQYAASKGSYPIVDPLTGSSGLVNTAKLQVESS